MSSRTKGHSYPLPGASPGSHTGSASNASFNSSYRSSSGIEDDDDYTGDLEKSINDDLNLTHEVNVLDDISPVQISRSELRRRETLEVQKHSPGSPRPKRRSPRLANPNPSPGVYSSSPGFYGDSDNSYSKQKEALIKGRGNTRKVGVGDIKTGPSPRRPIHRSPIKSTEQHTESPIKNFTHVCIGCALIFIAIIFIFVIKPFSSKTPILKSAPPEVLPRTAILENYIQQITQLHSMFPNQDRRLWSVVSAAVKRVIKDEYPKQPAVLMFVSNQGNSEVTDCIARQVTHAVQQAYNSSKSLEVDLKRDLTAGKNPDGLKLELDDILSSSFGAGNKAGVLFNIQDLPSRTAMLFHSYCDNENAPFKDIVLTFTVKIGIQMQQFASSDETVEEFFYKLWSDMDKDTLSPLLSRVANSVAIVKSEDAQVINQNCH